MMLGDMAKVWLIWMIRDSKFGGSCDKALRRSSYPQQGGFDDGGSSVVNEASSLVAGLWVDPWIGTIVA
jgi:hypothetical protein